jgi:energy-coupling factor transporter transmembrane protein EcfT
MQKNRTAACLKSGKCFLRRFNEHNIFIIVFMFILLLLTVFYILTSPIAKGTNNADVIGMPSRNMGHKPEQGIGNF